MPKKEIKFVIVAQKYLNKRAIYDLRLDELASTMDVEYWDVSSLIGSPMGESDFFDKVECQWAKTIDTFNDLKRNLSSIPSDSIIAIYTFMQYSTYRLYRKIAEYMKCAVLVVNNSTFWNDCSAGHTKLDVLAQEDITAQKKGSSKMSFIKRTKHLVYKIEILQKIIKYFRFRGDERYKQWKDQLYAQKIRESFQYFLFVGMSQEADYHTCSPHYDVVLELEKQRRNETKPYIVFLDSYYPMHPDWRNRVPNFDWAALQKPYFKSLNKFFDKVEQQYNCEVIIGAHPNAIYETNPYGSRNYYKYKSVELVKHAKAVMMHATNSATFVAYFDKPFCFLTNDAFKAGDFPRCMYGATVNMAKVLRMPLVDTDHVECVDGIFKKLDFGLRKRFLDCYFGDCTKSETYAEQLKSALVDIHNRIKYNKIC